MVSEQPAMQPTDGVPVDAIADSAAAVHNEALTFPDLPRLELEQLLGQLVERATEVMATQGRLRGLLHANQMIVGNLALPVVLRRIAEAARELIGAEYAALGVIAPDGFLSEFVHVGMAPEIVEQIGRLPQGKGLLGALIDDPQPIRLNKIADDPRSSGFPPHHPPMNSFLGVPIRVRNEVFGNLYLSESLRGEFTAEDEDLVKSLAATAAVAIENARLYEAAKTRQDWLQATATISRQLLSAEPSRPLALIAERTKDIARADLVTVVLPGPTDDSDLRVDVAVGESADTLIGLRLPLAESLSGRVYSTGRPMRLLSPGEQPGLALVAARELEIGPVMVVPLVGSQRVHGVLTAARLAGQPAFSAEDLEMASGFSNQAAVAIELAEARNEQQRAAMLDERERIAADLHDHVIQSLFAAGLTLQAVATRLPPGPSTDRLLSTIGGLDDTIRKIRESIFQLSQPPRAGQVNVRARVLDAVADVAPALGFEPVITFTGAIDDLPSGDVTDDMVAVLHEALSNVARHARASAVCADITADAGGVTVVVRDDGRGMQDTQRRSGLANLRRRAERRGGAMQLLPADPNGTELRWSVPISR